MGEWASWCEMSWCEEKGQKEEEEEVDGMQGKVCPDLTGTVVCGVTFTKLLYIALAWEVSFACLSGIC